MKAVNRLDGPLTIAHEGCVPGKSIGRETLALDSGGPYALASIPAAAAMAIVQCGSDNATTAQVIYTLDGTAPSGTEGFRAASFGQKLYLHGQGAMAAFQAISTVATIAEVEYYA